MDLHDIATLVAAKHYSRQKLSNSDRLILEHQLRIDILEGFSGHIFNHPVEVEKSDVVGGPRVGSKTAQHLETVFEDIEGYGPIGVKGVYTSLNIEGLTKDVTTKIFTWLKEQGRIKEVSRGKYKAIEL